MRKFLDFGKKIRKTILRKTNGWVEWAAMTKERRIEISRDDWKEKARIRADELRDSRKARRRDREQIQSLKDENRRLKKQIKKKRTMSGFDSRWHTGGTARKRDAGPLCDGCAFCECIVSIGASDTVVISQCGELGSSFYIGH